MGLSKRLMKRTAIADLYTVDGAFVRNRCDIDFIGGGHQLVYPWMPRGEAWIEATLGSDGRFIAAHELSEIFDMLTRGWSYERAHAKANRVEKVCRNTHGRGGGIMIGAVRSIQPRCADVIADAVRSWPGRDSR